MSNVVVDARDSSFQLAGLVQFSLLGWQCTTQWSVPRMPSAGVLLRKSKYDTAIVPSPATCTAGVNACWSPSGSVAGVWLTLMGADQLLPPSVDCVNAI